MAEAKGIKIGDEVRTFKDETARDAASAANDKAEQALTDASEALQETVALEADLPERVKQIVAAMLPQETLLWTNPNPLADFVEQNISIPNLWSYDELKLYFTDSKQTGYGSTIVPIKLDNHGAIYGVSIYNGPADGYTTTYISRRCFRIMPNQNIINMYEAVYVNFEAGKPIELEINHDRQIPYQIFGIKYPK